MEGEGGRGTLKAETRKRSQTYHRGLGRCLSYKKSMDLATTFCWKIRSDEP